MDLGGGQYSKPVEISPSHGKYELIESFIRQHHSSVSANTNGILHARNISYNRMDDGIAINVELLFDGQSDYSKKTLFVLGDNSTALLGILEGRYLHYEFG